MAEVIVFPDCTALVIGYLRTELAARFPTATVGSRIPSPNPGDFVRIFRTGGVQQLLVTDQVQLTVEAYADQDGDDERAHDLAQIVRGLLHALPGTMQSGVPFYGVTELSGPQNLPDPVTNKPRFTQSLHVSVRGAAA